jgi:hypothetical protein
LADCRISPSLLLGVGGTVVVDGEDETRLLDALRPPAPFFLHLHPDQTSTADSVRL